MEEKIVKILKTRGIELAYMFGSQARGTAGIFSDVDIAVFFSRSLSVEEERKQEEEIRHHIGEALNINRVDIVNLKTSNNIALCYKILFEGKALIVRNTRLKHALEFYYLRNFEDTKHLRNTQFNILKNKIYVAD